MTSLYVGVLFVIVITGCERGCLAQKDRARANASGGPGIDLSGTDCSDGMVRCAAGRIEASRAAHLPHPCGDPGALEKRGGCTCPWDVIGQCTSGCAEEGLEVLAPPDAGAKVCRPDAPVARPMLPGDPFEPTVCTSEGVQCTDGIVRQCESSGRPSRAIAFCLAGCDPGIAIDHGEPANPDGVSMILCRRPHAERR
jgi:hypothetical protein